MYRTAALLVGTDSSILAALEASAKLVRDIMYIPLSCSSSHSSTRAGAHRIELIHQCGSKHNPSLDIRILLPISGYSTSTYPPLSTKIDALLSTCPDQQSVRVLPSYKYLKNRIVELHNTPFVHITTDPSLTEHDNDDVTSADEAAAPNNGLYGTVALGGTFDRMHSGHNLLLTYSAYMCTDRIIVGISDGVLLASKVLAELIEPLEHRISNVKRFLTDVKPVLQMDVVAINDVYGPTGYDPDVDCIVVSQETSKGGEIVNIERQKKGLKTLAVEIIDMIKGEDDKISSTDLRKKQLGEYRDVEPSRCIASHDPLTGPYIIGLTGGIASGKSSICKRLNNLGAFTINCDQLGHQAYQPGTDCFESVVKHFGAGIVSKDGTIDRKALGAMVFADKSKLDQLTSIVWPEIWRLAHQLINDAWNQGYRVCVVDAAVLLEAKWDQFVHEVWVTIIPPKEALHRIMERDGATEEAAKRRIDSQLSNEDRVEKAHVILSTLWQPEETQKQVEKAWTLLESRLSKV